jgi:hypothetical protein
MSYFYKQIDSLPSIPRELLTDLEKFYSNKLNVYRATLDLDPDTVKFDYKTEYNGSLDQKTFYNFEITESPLLTWLKENIATDAIQHGITVFGAYADNNRPFHIDYSRDYVLMYVTDTGGTDVITSFFKSTTRPLVLDNDTYSTFEKEELTLLDSVKIEPEKWMFMHTKVIHQVSQLTGIRRSVQLGFNYDKYNLNTSATLLGD